MSVHEKMLEDAERRLKMWYNKIENNPDWQDDPGMVKIITRAEDDVYNLKEIVDREKRIAKRRKRRK